MDNITKNLVLEEVFDFCFMVVGMKYCPVEFILEWHEELIVNNFASYVSSDKRKMPRGEVAFQVNAPLFSGLIMVGTNGYINLILLDVKEEDYRYLRSWARHYLDQSLTGEFKDYKWRKAMFGFFQSVNHNLGPYASFVHMPFSAYQLQFNS